MKMQWEIIYEEPGTKDTYKGIPGRLHTPTPEGQEELLAAVKFILERNRAVRLRISACGSAFADEKPHHD